MGLNDSGSDNSCYFKCIIKIVKDKPLSNTCIMCDEVYETIPDDDKKPIQILSKKSMKNDYLIEVLGIMILITN